jgi:two-component SAPR family response regulator
MNMMSPKGKTLIIDDDLGPRLLMNKIFGQMISKMNIIEFIQKIKNILPQMNIIIKNYFGGKFINS